MRLCVLAVAWPLLLCSVLLFRCASCIDVACTLDPNVTSLSANETDADPMVRIVGCALPLNLHFTDNTTRNVTVVVQGSALPHVAFAGDVANVTLVLADAYTASASVYAAHALVVARFIEVPGRVEGLTVFVTNCSLVMAPVLADQTATIPTLSFLHVEGSLRDANISFVDSLLVMANTSALAALTASTPTVVRVLGDAVDGMALTWSFANVSVATGFTVASLLDVPHGNCTDVAIAVASSQLQVNVSNLFMLRGPRTTEVHVAFTNTTLLWLPLTFASNNGVLLLSDAVNVSMAVDGCNMTTLFIAGPYRSLVHALVGGTRWAVSVSNSTFEDWDYVVSAMRLNGITLSVAHARLPTVSRVLAVVNTLDTADVALFGAFFNCFALVSASNIWNTTVWVADGSTVDGAFVVNGYNVSQCSVWVGGGSVVNVSNVRFRSNYPSVVGAFGSYLVDTRLVVWGATVVMTAITVSSFLTLGQGALVALHASGLVQNVSVEAIANATVWMSASPSTLNMGGIMTAGNATDVRVNVSGSSWTIHGHRGAILMIDSTMLGGSLSINNASNVTYPLREDTPIHTSGLVSIYSRQTSLAVGAEVRSLNVVVGSSSMVSVEYCILATTVAATQIAVSTRSVVYLTGSIVCVKHVPQPPASVLGVAIVVSDGAAVSHNGSKPLFMLANNPEFPLYNVQLHATDARIELWNRTSAAAWVGVTNASAAPSNTLARLTFTLSRVSIAIPKTTSSGGSDSSSAALSIWRPLVSMPCSLDSSVVALGDVLVLPLDNTTTGTNNTTALAVGPMVQFSGAVVHRCNVSVRNVSVLDANESHTQWSWAVDVTTAAPKGLWSSNVIGVSDMVGPWQATALVTLRGAVAVHLLALNISNITGWPVGGATDNRTSSLCSIEDNAALANSTLLFEHIHLLGDPADSGQAASTCVDAHTDSAIGDTTITLQSVAAASLRSIVQLQGNVSGVVAVNVLQGSNLSMWMGAVEWAPRIGMEAGGALQSTLISLAVVASYATVGGRNGTWDDQGCGLLLLLPPPTANATANWTTPTSCLLEVSNSTVWMADACALLHADRNQQGVRDAAVKILNGSRVRRLDANASSSYSNTTSSSSPATTGLVVHAKDTILLGTLNVTVSDSAIETVAPRPLIHLRLGNDTTSSGTNNATPAATVRLWCVHHTVVHLGEAARARVEGEGNGTLRAASLVVLDHASSSIATYVYIATMANITAKHVVEAVSGIEANQQHSVVVADGAWAVVDGAVVAATHTANQCHTFNATTMLSVHVKDNASVSCRGNGGASQGLVHVTTYGNATEEGRHCGDVVVVEVVVANASTVTIAPLLGDGNASEPWLVTAAVVDVAAARGHPPPMSVSVAIDAGSSLDIAANASVGCAVAVVLHNLSDIDASSAMPWAFERSSLTLAVRSTSLLSMAAASATQNDTLGNTSAAAITSLLLLVNATTHRIEALPFGTVSMHASEGSQLSFASTLSAAYGHTNDSMGNVTATVDVLLMRCGHNVSVVVDGNSSMQLHASSNATRAAVRAAVVGGDCPAWWAAVGALVMDVSVTASTVLIGAMNIRNSSSWVSTNTATFAALVASFPMNASTSSLDGRVSLRNGALLNASAANGSAFLARLDHPPYGTDGNRPVVLHVSVASRSAVHIAATDAVDNGTTALAAAVFGGHLSSASALQLDVHGSSAINVSATDGGSAAGCQLTTAAVGSHPMQATLVFAVTDGAHFFLRARGDLNASAVVLRTIGPIFSNVTIANASVGFVVAPPSACAAAIVASGMHPTVHLSIDDAAPFNATLISVAAAYNASVWVGVGGTSTATLFAPCSLVSVADSVLDSVRVALKGNVSCGTSVVAVDNASSTQGAVDVEGAPWVAVNTSGPLVSVSQASNLSAVVIRLRDPTAVASFGHTSALWVGNGSYVRTIQVSGGTLSSQTSSCLMVLSNASRTQSIVLTDATVSLASQPALLPSNQTSLVCLDGAVPPDVATNVSMLVDALRFASLVLPSDAPVPYLTAPVGGAASAWSSLVWFDVTFGCVMANASAFLRYPTCLVNASCTIDITCPAFWVRTASLSLSHATASDNGTLSIGSPSLSASMSQPTRSASGGTATRLRNSSSESATVSRPSRTISSTRSEASPSKTHSPSDTATEGSPTASPSASTTDSTTGTATEGTPTASPSASTTDSTTTSVSESMYESGSESASANTSASPSRNSSSSRTLEISPTTSLSSNATASRSPPPTTSHTVSVQSSTASGSRSPSPTTTASPSRPSATHTIPLLILAAPESNTALAVGLGVGLPLGLLLLVLVVVVVHRVCIAPRKTFASLKEEPTNKEAEDLFDGVALPRDLGGLMDGDEGHGSVEMLEQPFVVVHGGARYTVAQEDEEGFYDSEGYYHYYVDDDE